ncbi:hypothetical protein GCM10009555_088810 [Acrocarpospora macrocephala]|uniref:Lipopolysaccharide assembly protein A domain-containing protein n=1 Tax=Acrocarpospora macrocephala TaxID=150177 RepID=A0A5M3WYQ4_9ACTN|nr:hypothetical protein [Acrocarpospora macrocephala]GES14094.1 hypothetical protein Amac_076910 [Acrocarpospora macrocephala]
MVLLGLLLIVVAVVVAVQVFMLDSTVTTSVSVLDRTLSFTSVEVFVAGAATAVALLLGLALVVGGMHRSALRRRRRREAHLAERNRVSRLESEKRDLEKRLDTADRDHTGVDDQPVPAQTRTEDATLDPDGTRVPPDSDKLVAGARHAHRPDENH